MLVCVLLAGSTCAQGCAAQRRRSAQPKPPPAPTQTPAPARDEGTTVDTNGELKELAAGAYGPLRDAFVVAARDAQTYAQLRALVKDLPDQSADFFQTHVVVAAFLGQRSSGGYSIALKRTGRNGLSLVEQGPPKGAMVTMALTAPFRVVALPLGLDDALALTLDTAWQQRQRPYRVTSGELTVIGGFAGIKEQSTLTGTLRVMRAGDLATFTFDVQSKGGATLHRLTDTATGSVDQQGRVTLPRVDAYALSGAIESLLRMSGQFTDGEQNLSLSFETVPVGNVSDNFSAQGKLAAVATAPAPANKASADGPM